MNRNYINIALAFLVVLLLIALVLIVRSPAAGNPPAAISVSTSTIATTASTYTIAADYPVFGIPDLDSKIVDIVHVGVANIEGVAANPDGTKNQFISSFDSVYIDANDASVRLILSEYTGGAHDISAAVGLTYDRQTNTFLTLDDALVLTGDTLQQVSAIAKTQLTAQFAASPSRTASRRRLIILLLSPSISRASYLRSKSIRRSRFQMACRRSSCRA